MNLPIDDNTLQQVEVKNQFSFDLTFSAGHRELPLRVPLYGHHEPQMEITLVLITMFGCFLIFLMGPLDVPLRWK